MNCTRMRPRTHWRNVGFTAARRGIAYTAVKLPDGNAANEWIREGMEKWQRKVGRKAGKE